MTTLGKSASGSKAADRRRRQRDMLFPDSESLIWDRKKKKGFTTIPRTLPLILRIMDDLSPGFPLADTYLELWCRGFDEAFVELDRQKEMAFSSGFFSQRNVQTWGDRIDRLARLGFIKLEKGPHGARSYALIVNPYTVIAGLGNHPGVNIMPELLNTLKMRASTIGAEDLNPPPPPAPQSPPLPPPPPAPQPPPPPPSPPS